MIRSIPVRVTLTILLILLPGQALSKISLPGLNGLAASGARVSAMFSVDGKTVAELSPDRMVNPASVTKLFTAALALHVPGPDQRVRTEVHTTGDDRLVLIGGGDPELTDNDLEELAACVAAKTKGREFSEVAFSTGPFNREDLPPAYGQKSTSSAYRAGIAGIQINRNRLAVGIGRTGPGERARVQITPMSDYIRLKNTARASLNGKKGRRQRNRNPLRINTSVDASGRMEVTVSGRCRPNKAQGRAFRVDNPAWNAAATFVKALRKKKVSVKTTLPDRIFTPGSSNRICFKPSYPVSRLNRSMLKKSVNPIAETMLRLAGAHGAKSQVGFTEGPAAMRDFLVHKVLVPPESFSITNGSGLYDANRITARAAVTLTEWILKEDSLRRHMRRALPVGGVDGTLRGRFRSKPLKGTVFAKTGTLNRVVALAGWVELPGKKNLSFAVLVESDKKLNASSVRSKIDSAVSRVVRSVSAP